MKYPRLNSHILKIFAVVAASLMLPGLALAGTDKDKGNDGQNNGNQHGKTRDRDPGVSSVPEANPVIVVIPFVGAILLFLRFTFCVVGAVSFLPRRTTFGTLFQ